MAEDSEDKLNWTAYSIIAAIYVKAGLFKKADLAVKKLEEMKPREREAYRFLISLYADTSNLGEVNRIWNYLKSAFPPSNIGYNVPLQALAKLKAIDMLKECFKEWESICTLYDMRLATVVICAYLEQDMYDEASSVFDDAIKRAKGPHYSAREAFMIYYLSSRQLELALNEMDAAVSEAGGDDCYPKEETLNAFFKLFEEEKDVGGAEDFSNVLKSQNFLNSRANHLLMRTYIAGGKLAPEMRQRLEEDDIEISDKLEKLLAKVCPR